nr:MAG TPA: hypothetical protein [Bacteriophage sp.]
MCLCQYVSSLPLSTPPFLKGFFILSLSLGHEIWIWAETFLKSCKFLTLSLPLGHEILKWAEENKKFLVLCFCI